VAETEGKERKENNLVPSRLLQWGKDNPKGKVTLCQGRLAVYRPSEGENSGKIQKKKGHVLQASRTNSKSGVWWGKYSGFAEYKRGFPG